MSLRVGSVVYATNQGLGILAKDFYYHGVVTDVVVIEHAHHPSHFDWYHGASIVPIRRLGTREARNAFRQLLERVDLMLFFETPFDWTLLHQCRQANIKTILMTMYECTPKTLPQTPDVFFCPSRLDLDYFANPTSKPDLATLSPDPFEMISGVAGTKAVFTPVPVDQVKFPWRQRVKAEVFVHNAGYGGLKGRNGTGELLDAMALVQSPIKLLLRSQKELAWDCKRDPRITLQLGTQPQDTLYRDGDVFLFPEKFNGLSLPLQEAYASGMLVMGSQRFPMTTWLPTEPLIPIQQYVKNSVSPRCFEFEEAVLDPKIIAQTIDAWYGKDITEYSNRGGQWACDSSWGVLGPQYQRLLENCYTT